MTVVIEEVPFPADRVENAPWLGAERKECPECGDDATVTVGISEAGTDENAPCRRCQRGFMLEFGYGRRKVVKGRRETKEFFRNLYPPWGQDGYWARNSSNGPAVDVGAAPTGNTAVIVSHYSRMLAEKKIDRAYLRNKVLPQLEALGLTAAKAELEPLAAAKKLPEF